MSRNTVNTGKDGMPTQVRLTFHTRTNSNTNPNPRTSSPTHTESENKEFQILVDKAVAWKLMARGDDWSMALPDRMLQLVVAAKETSRTKTALNEALDKIALAAKIMQEWSWRDKTEERKIEIMESIAGELTMKTNKKGEKVEGIAMTAQTTWARLEEVTNKITEISTKIATLGNSLPDSHHHSDGEDGELTDGPLKASYAHAARAHALPAPTHHNHHQHNSVVREADIKDCQIVVISQTPSDWTLGEREIVLKANLAIATVVGDEGAETIKPEVVAATKIANKGAFLLLRSMEEAKWMKQDDRMQRLAAAWGSTTENRNGERITDGSHKGNTLD
ncbi:hypothetical protein J3R30DRAFT_3404074 [Lentinula aciculospora]|uniref:Uncharacterized protein n=1 Tax=Lentinula aciculospora TaxID=153920 RepID=A0A9W9ACZ7_9AGAR|nr:hypothetical protein J3R30DRAFT_3404074 [Lentinula aciculospora]